MWKLLKKDGILWAGVADAALSLSLAARESVALVLLITLGLAVHGSVVVARKPLCN